MGSRPAFNGPRPMRTGGEGELEETSRETGAWLDEGKEAPRRHVQPFEDAPQFQDDLTRQPVFGEMSQGLIEGEHRLRAPAGLQEDEADGLVVEPQIAQRVVELARHGQRPEVATRSVERIR